MNENEFCVCENDNCKLYLENPIILPCGSTICRSHVEIYTHKFECFVCKNEHLIPPDGFPLNKALQNIINQEALFVQVRKDLFKSFKKIELILKEHESIDSTELIYDYFANLRNKVDLHRDQMIEQIHKQSDQILRQLKYQEDIFNLNSKSLSKIDLNKLKNEYISIWKFQLRNPSLTENEMKIFLNEIDDKANMIQMDIQKYKNDSLIKNIEFIPIDSSLFGKLDILNKSLFKSPCCFDQKIRDFDGHLQPISSIKIEEKSNRLISASYDGDIKIWNLETGQCIQTLDKHLTKVNYILLTFNKIFSCSSDETIKIWSFDDNKRSECLHTLYNKSEVFTCCLLPDNQLACGSTNGLINIWNLKKDKILMKSFKAHEITVKCLKLSKDSSKLISGSDDNKIKIWNLSDFKCLNQLCDHTSSINTLEISSNGSLLTGSNDKTLKVWNILNGQLLKTIQFDSMVNCIKLIKNDLIVIGTDSAVLVFNLNEEKIIRNFSHSFMPISNFKLLSNGNLVTSSGNHMKLWNFLQKK